MFNNEISDVINSVKANASPTISNKIDILVGLCESQIERGSSDFSVALIGKLFQSLGGVGPQAIRNKTGARYKAVISVFDKFYGSKLTASQSASNGGVPDWVDQISDSNARWLVKDLLGENKRLARTLQAHQVLNKENAQLIDMRPHSNVPTLVTKTLDDFEVDALMDFFRDDNLEQLGLFATENGQLRDNSEGKRAVTPPGFIKIINKLCGLDNQDNCLIQRGSEKTKKS